ncbi:hypothetical protein KCU93_g347, partial [Aureobasidium melanogenum]
LCHLIVLPIYLVLLISVSLSTSNFSNIDQNGTQEKSINSTQTNSPAYEDEKELDIQALKFQVEQLRNEKQDLESTRETYQQRLGELERDMADLKDENDRLTKENAELKEKQERVEALGGINELEEDQKRLEKLGGLDQIEEE